MPTHKKTIILISAIAFITFGAFGLKFHPFEQGNSLKFNERIAHASPQEQTVVLQNGLEIQDQIYLGSDDAMIYQPYPDTNYQSYAGGGMLVGATNRARILIRFDISQIPSDAQIESATLSLYCHTVSAEGAVNLHQITKTDWIEDKVTWNTYDGVNPWSTPGGDFNSTPILNFTPTAGTWSNIDVTSIVQGYIDGSLDARAGFLLTASTWFKEFWHSEYSEVSLRPKLTVTYTSDAPIANAGPNQEVGRDGLVTLDATASSDPVENPKDLIYRWHFLSKPLLSNLNDDDISPNNTTGWNGADQPQFTVDALGDYEIELTVIDKLGVSDKDYVTVTSFYVRDGHPRIWLTPERVSLLKQRAAAFTPQWMRLKEYVDTTSALEKVGSYGTPLYWSISSALVYQVTGEASYGRDAIDVIMRDYVSVPLRESTDNPPILAYVAVIYDWTYELLTESEMNAVITWMNNGYELYTDYYLGTWESVFVSTMRAIGFAGYATYGDNPKAKEMIEHSRYTRYENILLPFLQNFGKGGGFAEQNGYGHGTAMRLVDYLQAVYSATGEDLSKLTLFYQDRLLYEIMSIYPGIKHKYGTIPYRELSPGGDGMRGPRGTNNYQRSTMLMLIDYFSETEIAKYAQSFVSQPPVDKVTVELYMYYYDFLWYNPDQPSLSLSNASLVNFAEGTGTVYMRSDWTDDATWISFQSGDHFTFHQHLDQNSFAIYKYEDLAIDSGTYDGNGTGSHANNYYVRTIAHNSVTVYNPSEVWAHMRGGYDGANDGGQRVWHDVNVVRNSASWSAEDLDYWYAHQDIYDTADISRFEHNENYTYVLGDATNAYRQEKLNNFTRQLIFLRPDYVVVFDRVSATNPNFTKSWLLHFINEPTIDGTETQISPGDFEYDGSLVIADNGKGRLFSKTLFPKSHKIRKVGGSGYDAWVDGKNYPIATGYYGEWRVEVQPTVPQNDDIFLHVLYPTHVGVESMPTTSRIEGDSMAGVQIAERVVMFSKTEQNQTGVIYTLPQTTALVKHLIADLAPNFQYNIYKDGELLETKGSSSEGTLYFVSQGASSFEITQGAPTPAPQTPNLTLLKSADKTTVQEGETITYTIAYQNTGQGEARNVVITDTIPQGAAYVQNSATGGGTYDGSKLMWTIPALAPNSQGTVSFQVGANYN